MKNNLDALSDIYRAGISERTIAGTVALAILLAVPAAAPAADCSIETHGEAAYTRVTERIQEKLYKIEQFTFEPYEKTDIMIEPGCIFVLHGGFGMKVQRNQVQKVYDARLTPKSGAPHGMKILRIRISGG